jgi:Tol biopolymer transport system component
LKAIAAAAVVMAIVAVVSLATRRPVVHPPVIRFQIPVPDEATFALSPDGGQLAYSGGGRLWLRQLDAFTAHDLSGTEGAQHPFWSPDGRWIGFVSGGKLRRIPAGGGPAAAVCNARRFTSGVWNAEGEILFGDGGVLYSVPAAGGVPSRLIDFDNSRGDLRHRYPQLLPGSRRFLFSTVSSKPENGGIYAAEPGRRMKMLSGDTMAAVAEGYLLADRSGVLVAIPFDAAQLATRGEARVVRFAEHVRSFSVAGSTLAYRAGMDRQVQLAWFDRNGQMQGPVTEPAEDGPVSLSPQGREVATVRRSGMWLLDLERKTDMRFTSGEGWVTSAAWSPDGMRIAFGRLQATGGSIWVKQSNGGGEPELLLHTNGRLAADSWSADGRFLLYDAQESSVQSGIWQLPMQGERKPVVVLRSEFVVRDARLSPDVRWMAYVSNETGRDEIYVRAVAGAGSKWMISSEGGSEPRWSRTGTELFFLSPEGALMSVEIRGEGETLRAGTPRSLFFTRKARAYDVSPDGRRFLIPWNPKEPENESIYVVLNWADDLHQ